MNPMETDPKPQPEPEIWAVVQLMGHQKHAGRLLEVERFGGKLGRVEVPQKDGGFASVFFGASAVYKIEIVTEDVARHVAMHGGVSQPVSAWDFPKALVAGYRSDHGFSAPVDSDPPDDSSDLIADPVRRADDLEDDGL